jgi:hypothetical protein
MRWMLQALLLISCLWDLLWIYPILGRKVAAAQLRLCVRKRNRAAAQKFSTAIPGDPDFPMAHEVSACIRHICATSLTQSQRPEFVSDKADAVSPSVKGYSLLTRYEEATHLRFCKQQVASLLHSEDARGTLTLIGAIRKNRAEVQNCVQSLRANAAETVDTLLFTLISITDYEAAKRIWKNYRLSMGKNKRTAARMLLCAYSSTSVR